MVSLADDTLQREISVMLRESYTDMWNTFNYSYSRAANVARNGETTTDFGFPSALHVPMVQNDRGRGDQLPVYVSDQQLKDFRDESRTICYNNEFAICGLENRVNYCVGENGLITVAVPRDEHNTEHKLLAAKVNDFIDVISEINDLPTYTSNSLRKWDIDGESFTRCFYDDNGITLFRRVQPEHVYSPESPNSPETSYGIKVAKNDVNGRVLGYFVQENPYYNTSPVEVSSEDIVHLTNNVIEGKRGIPTYYPVVENLRRVEQLQASMTTMARIRAKIALIEKMAGVSQATATALQQRIQAGSTVDVTTGQTVSLNKLPNAAWIRTNGDVTLPPQSIGASDFVEVLQSELRAIACRLQMSEWMFTALADAKYSNALVAEAPALRTFKRIQATWCRYTGTNRYAHRAALLWRALRYAVKSGVLPKETLYSIKLNTTGPQIETRDKKADADTNAIYISAGVKTVKQVQDELGIDTAKTNDAVKLSADNINLVTDMVAKVINGSLPPATAKLLTQMGTQLGKDVVETLFTDVEFRPPPVAKPKESANLVDLKDSYADNNVLRQPADTSA